MRIIHVIWKADFGGIEKLVLDLATVQQKDPDIEVAVFFGMAKGALLETFKKSGLTLLDGNLKSGHDFSPRKLNQLIKTFRDADIVHVHTFLMPIAFALLRVRKSVVYTEHGNFGFGRKRTIADRIKAPLARYFLRRGVDYLTFNSEFTDGVWHKRVGILGLDNSVVKNGISFHEPDISKAATDILRWADGACVVGTTTRFAGFKRIDRLIHGFAAFSKACDARLVLVGDGPLRSSLESLVRDLGIAEKTKFTGFRRDVQACQNAMDVCVFPSQNEPFGLVCIETLAQGKPTIVFDDGGGMADIVRSICAEDIVESTGGLADRLCFYSTNAGACLIHAERRRSEARKYDIRNTAGEFKQIYGEFYRKRLRQGGKEI